ncbi:MAG: DMT family transporter [Bacteroidales bacterium]|nr:DMT family transporter [Bacteroidales bacterium]
MLKNKTIKGYIFAFIAAIALANSFVFSKAALKEIDFIQFGFIWFAFGVSWNLLYVIIRKNVINKSLLSKKTVSISLIIALLEAIATGLFYIAINRVENPAIVSFIGNIGPVFVVILGVYFLKEKYSWFGGFGILLTIGGVFIISYRGNFILTNLFIEGTEFVVMASLFFSVATILARKYRTNLNPTFLSFIRSILLFVSFLVLFIVFNKNLEIPRSAFGNILIGSFLETFITIIFAYEALKHIEASQTSLIISTKSIFVLLGAFLYFHIFPSYLHVFGGLLTIIGVMIIIKKRIKY